jgi:adenylyltransferase/sulfurtransferase
MALSTAERARYARHLAIPEVGAAGQERLQAARVLLVGVGGLGSPVALYLAAAGVGTLGLVDDDLVAESNLQRQVLYGQADVGRPKLAAAMARLADVNPHVHCEPHALRLSAANAMPIVQDYDVVVDGSDNFATRYLVSDACVLAGKPDVYGSIFRFEGQVSVFAAGGPCYRCLYPAPPPAGTVPSCAEGGVLGVLPGLVGSLQAVEVLKLLLGVGRPLVGRLLLVDALRPGTREVRLRQNPACPACGSSPSRTTLVDEPDACPPMPPNAPLPDGSPAMTDVPVPFEIDVHELAAWRASGRAFQLLDVRTPHEASLACLDGAVLIPMAELPRRLAELDPAAELVVHCHIGGRSAQAVQFLRRQGFPRARNLAGGIEAWSREIDATVPRY